MYICFHGNQEETVVIVTPLVLHLSTQVKRKCPSEVHEKTLLDF